MKVPPVLSDFILLSFELKVIPDVVSVLDIFRVCESVLKECLFSIDFSDRLLLEPVEAIVGGSTKGWLALLILLNHPRKGLKRMLVDV